MAARGDPWAAKFRWQGPNKKADRKRPYPLGHSYSGFHCSGFRIPAVPPALPVPKRLTSNRIGWQTSRHDDEEVVRQGNGPTDAKADPRMKRRMARWVLSAPFQIPWFRVPDSCGGTFHLVAAVPRCEFKCLRTHDGFIKYPEYPSVLSTGLGRSLLDAATIMPRCARDSWPPVVVGRRSESIGPRVIEDTVRQVEPISEATSRSVCLAGQLCAVLREGRSTPTTIAWNPPQWHWQLALQEIFSENPSCLMVCGRRLCENCSVA